MTEDMIISVTDDASYGILERGKELREIQTSSLISTVRKHKCLTLVQAGTCMLHVFFSFFFFSIAQDYKLLFAKSYHSAQSTSIKHLFLSMWHTVLFPTHGARETSSYLWAHNVSYQMQNLDYVLFDIHVRADFCLCGLVWSIVDILKILLLLK